MIRKVVAYESSLHPVFIPMRLVCARHPYVRCFSKSSPDEPHPISEDELERELAAGSLVRAPDGSEIGDGLWLAIEDGRAVQFPLGAEESWRASRAQDLLQQFRSPGGNPLQKLQMLRAAGDLVGLDVARLVKAVDSGARPGETIEQAFERLRRG